MVKPIVILTSNAARDLGDALKRRCLHLHIGFPDLKLESRIIATRVPGIEAKPAQADRCGSSMKIHFTLDLEDCRRFVETIDWAQRDAVAARPLGSRSEMPCGTR